MYIRRDKSNLHFGRQARRSGSKSLFIIWLITMAAAVGVIWRFNSVQSWVLAGVSGQPTATLDAITLARMGERAYLVGDLEASIDYYGQASRLSPRDIDIMFEYGRVLIYQSYAGRSYRYLAADALEVAQQAVEVDENNPRAQALLSFALMENDRYEEAIQHGLAATQAAPDYAEAHAYLAMAYWGAGRSEAALDSATIAVEKNPNSVDSRRALASALSFYGEYDAAIQQYEFAIQLQPRLGALYFELARYYVALQNYDAAIAAYDQVLVNDPNNVKAWTRKCETYFTMRDDQRAQEACEQAVQLDPAYPEAWRQLGMVRYTRKNYEGSIEAFDTCSTLQTQQGVVLADQEIECYYLRGLASALLDECNDAWDPLQTALSMNPSTRIEEIIRVGMNLCVNFGGQDPASVPTQVPPTPIPPEPIGIF